jgi:hypothetical protein
MTIDSQLNRSPPGGGQITGQVTYIFAYDVAHDMARRPIDTLLGQKVTQYQPTVLRGPREQFFYAPQMAVLPTVEGTVPDGQPVQVRRSVKLFPVGAVSISYHVPFAVSRIEDLHRYHDLALNGVSLQQEARELANRIVAELGEALIRPVVPVRDEEAYTVFCLDAAALAGGRADFSAEDWLGDHRHLVAGLLNNDDGSRLAETEALDTTSHSLSYSRDDLVVMDWDAALVVEHPAGLAEVLHVMELANVQLAELEAYDRLLDDSLARSYRDLYRRRLRAGRGTLQNLREIRLDLSRLSDELSNTTKFFGDWHLAKIYQRLFVLFHLSDWQKVIDEKLSTVGDIYEILQHDRFNRWMFGLEVAIVLLFIIDLVALVLMNK